MGENGDLIHVAGAESTRINGEEIETGYMAQD